MEGGDHSPQIPTSRGNETSQGTGAQDGHSCHQNRLGIAVLFDIGVILSLAVSLAAQISNSCESNT